MKRKLIGLLVVIMMLLFSAGTAFGHPGRTDSYGGHYVRTSGWGYPVGSYHYHSGPYAGYSVSYKGEVPAAFKGTSSTSKSSSAKTASPAKVNRIYATVPTFQIKANGQVVDSSITKYPFLSYKNIAYVPLTYGVCSVLGITSNWDNATGLTLSKGTSSGAAIAADYGAYNSPGQSKEISYPQFNIYLNGQWINNGSLPYPFMVFNNVTYMPLTWDNIQQLGLIMSWDTQAGLSISSQVPISNTLNMNMEVIQP